MENATTVISETIDRDMRIAVGVSGGMDSMCLLSLLLGSGSVDRDKITVVNVEHGIRGEASKKDSEFVRDFCTRNKLKFRLFSFDVLNRARLSGRSVEHEARVARREAFLEVADSGVSYILTAHHALDNAETVLMNVFRGSGLNGLKGMTLFSDLRAEKDGKVYKDKLFRPLLRTSKEQIQRFVNVNNVPFIEDETNLSSDYSRNFLRNEVFPQVLSRWKNAIENINSLSYDASEMNSCIKSTLDESLFSIKENEARIFDAALRSDFASYYIFEALNRLGIQKDFERVHIELIKGLVFGGINGRVDLPHNVIAYKDKDCVTLIKDSVTHKKEQNELLFCLGELNLANKAIFASLVDAEEFKAFALDNCKDYNKPLFLDYDKIPQGAVVRFRQEGDVFSPFNNGTKKLKEYFIDKKIPFRKRDLIPLLAVDNNILAVIGIEISNKVRVENETVKIIKITQSE